MAATFGGAGPGYLSVIDTRGGHVTDVPLPTTASQPAGSSSSPSSSCAACHKTGSSSHPLKLCAKCRKTTYCSRDCQKADWKTHKKDCSRFSAAGAQQSAQAPRFDQQSMLDGLSKSVLHNLSKKEVYRRLIDAYRMRVEDLYVFEGESTGLYGGDDLLSEFRKFLSNCEARAKDMLPEWWDPNARKECETLAMDESGGSYLKHAVKKSDIQDKYGDNMMPLKLRRLAEH
ncbi:MAG: hypothetical protein M1830_008667, partial [Pleopsidium flavum]